MTLFFHAQHTLPINKFHLNIARRSNPHRTSIFSVTIVPLDTPATNSKLSKYESRAREFLILIVKLFLPVVSVTIKPTGFRPISLNTINSSSQCARFKVPFRTTLTTNSRLTHSRLTTSDLLLLQVAHKFISNSNIL